MHSNRGKNRFGNLGATAVRQFFLQTKNATPARSFSVQFPLSPWGLHELPGSRRLRVVAVLGATLLAINSSRAATVFVEAESFAKQGGWTLDTQFINLMGSPYMLGHGLGKPVKDAETTVNFPAPGSYRVFARTKDWVAHWKAPGTPGRFQVAIDGRSLPHVFGTTNANWFWESGGVVEVETAGQHTLALRDLTGFDGRCDALFLTTDAAARPPETRHERKVLLGLPDNPPETETFDLVVCGGGYSGLGTAISAARQGLRVALIQDRPVLGGNGSSEIQVWAKGGTRRGIYPRLGEIVEEFADNAANSPGLPAEYGDDRKEALVRSEKNISLFLNSYIIDAEIEPRDPSQIRSVLVLDTRTGAERKIRGRFFADCTGHGSVGGLAGAKFRMETEGHLGMSNMWKWEEKESPSPWSDTPWALAMGMGDFPPTKKAEGPVPFFKGEWFWESGFNKHPLDDLEHIRDWNFRAVFGAFNAMKRGAEALKYGKAEMVWVAAIGGNRESRLLTGDVVLAREDIEQLRKFPDGCVPTTWDIDLHYPKEQYAKKFPDNPFISRAEFGSGVDKKDGYPVPYRCLYSTNIHNLFMAGRCISVTHGALGTVRVMRTGGMMGEVVGKAAYLSVKHQTNPRGVYAMYLEELKDLMRQPGAARRDSVDSPLQLPDKVVQLPPREFINEIELEGIVIDDARAVLKGKWTAGENLKPFVGREYRYASADSDATAQFEFIVPTGGRYEVRVAWNPHENRGTSVPCSLETADGVQTFELNQREKPAPSGIFHSLGVFKFNGGARNILTLSTKGARGIVHADCVQVVPVK